MTVLVTGATGFVGGHAARRLAASGVPVRALVRSGAGPDGAERWHGDLEDPASLRGCCAGVATVVHAASYVGSDEDLAERINARGTETLLREAARAGVERVVLVSTAAVYGDGAHAGAREGELVPHPVSAASRSRHRAEQAVLAYGGIVLRPLFVYGAGDRWFVPGVIRMAERLPFLVDRGRARLSVVSVDDLAAVVAALACGDRRGPDVFHVDDTRAPSFREILEVLERHLGVPVPRDEVPGSLAALVHAAVPPAWQRQLHLVSVDHFYDSSRVWAATGLRPGEPFAERFGEHAAWYRDSLREAA